MNKPSLVARNSLLLSAGHVVAKLANLALVLILTRHLGKDGFGLYSFGMAYVMLFSLFCNFGINTLLIRDIARRRDSAAELLPLSSGATLVFTVFTFAFIQLSALAIGLSIPEREVLLALSFYLIFDGWSRYLFAILRAYERMEYESLAIMAERFSMLVAALLCWFLDTSLLPLLWSFAAIQLAKALLSLIWVRRHFISFGLRLAWQPILQLMRTAAPFAMVAFFGLISTRIDVVMLKFFHGDVVAGVYNVARRLIESAIFLPENVYAALLPALSVLFVGQRQRFADTFGRVVNIMLIIALPVSILLVLLAPWSIDLLFEADFAGAALPLRWLAPVLGLLFIKYVFIAALNSSGQQLWMSVLAASSMLLNVLLNLLLIPRYEAAGAAMATLFSEALTLLLGIYLLKQLLQLTLLSRTLLLTLCAGGAAAGAALLLQFQGVFVQALSALVVYGACLAIFKIPGSDDMRFLRGMIKREDR